STYLAFTSFAMSACASFCAPCLSNNVNHCFQSLPVAFLTASSLTAPFFSDVFFSAMGRAPAELVDGHLGERVGLRGFLARQVRVDLEPWQLALDAVLDDRHGILRTIEAADGDVDALGVVVGEGQRRAALFAEAALGDRRRGEQARPAFRPLELVLGHAGERREHVAHRALAHAAMAQMYFLERRVRRVADCAALTAAGDRFAHP